MELGGWNYITTININQDVDVYYDRNATATASYIIGEIIDNLNINNVNIIKIVVPAINIKSNVSGNSRCTISVVVSALGDYIDHNIYNLGVIHEYYYQGFSPNKKVTILQNNSGYIYRLGDYSFLPKAGTYSNSSTLYLKSISDPNYSYIENYPRISFQLQYSKNYFGNNGIVNFSGDISLYYK